MAGKTKEMSQIKQLLLLKQDGVSNRKAAAIVGINKETVNNYVKKARFRYQASIGEVIYDGKRGVDKQKVLNLATCDYVRKGVSVLITGATGTGKSWLGTALGHQACMNGWHTTMSTASSRRLPLHASPAHCTVSLPSLRRQTCSYWMTLA